MAEQPIRPDPFWHPIRRRRFDSALLVLLALHRFPRLSATEQEDVENELVNLFKKTSTVPYLAWREILGTSSDLVAMVRGAAMARLNMPTGVDGLEWKEFVRPRWLRAPVLASLSYRKFDAIPDQAIEFLRSRGLAWEETSGHGLHWFTEMQARYP